MTVTAEMLDRVEAHLNDPNRPSMPYFNSVEVRAVVSLCRRVIEPGEEDLERCIRAACVVSGHDVRCDFPACGCVALPTGVRAVLAAIAGPTAS